VVDYRPVGLIMICGVLALLGTAGVVTNTVAIAAGLDRVPVILEIAGLLYGGLALVAAVLLWRRSPRTVPVFIAWGVLVLVYGVTLWPFVEAKGMLVVGFVGVLVLLGILHRLISGYCAKQPADSAERT